MNREFDKGATFKIFLFIEKTRGNFTLFLLTLLFFFFYIYIYICFIWKLYTFNLVMYISIWLIDILQSGLFLLNNYIPVIAALNDCFLCVLLVRVEQVWFGLGKDACGWRMLGQRRRLRPSVAFLVVYMWVRVCIWI